MQRTISLTLLGFESLLQTAKNIFFVAFIQKEKVAQCVAFSFLLHPAENRAHAYERNGSDLDFPH